MSTPSYNELNDEYYDILVSTDYPSKAGQLASHAYSLRAELKSLVHEINEDKDTFISLVAAENILKLTEYLESNYRHDGADESEGEESRDDIARYENRRIDNQERRS